MRRRQFADKETIPNCLFRSALQFPNPKVLKPQPEMLEKTIRKYQNKTIEAVMVIEELIELARKMREASKRGEKLGLAEDEIAFYDA